MKRFCSRPYRNLHCDPGGEVRFCSWMDIKIGNVLEQSVEDIWHGEKAERLRGTFRDGSFKFCRTTSCPFLENDSLERLDEEELCERSRPLHLPTVVYLANDFVCNHSCPSCRHEMYRVDKQYLVDFQKAGEALLPLLNQAEEICTCGNGDIFSSPHMMNLLARIRPQNEKYEFQIETNGVLFNEKNWNSLKNLHDSHITVTVTPNSYDKTTYRYLNGGHDDYEDLLSGLRFIRDLRRENEINIYNISIVVQESNYAELPSFIERSFNEFEADTVIVKPLYHWFKMSDDDFWFKDVLNPMHPYHESWKAVMNSPLMNDSRIYLWGAKNIHEAMRHPAYVFEDMLKIQNKLIANLNRLYDVIMSHINRIDASSLTFYGDNIITDSIVSLLSDKFKINLIARDSNRFKVGNVDILPLCKENLIDKPEIVILNFDKFCYVKRDLDFMQYDGDILTLPDWIKKIGL